jgi:2'-5' RNA ligase
VIFDQLVHGHGSTLLLPSDILVGVLRLQERLSTLLGAVDLHPASYWRFNPHMTLRRGKAVGETMAIDAVSWTAHEIVLLNSLIGLTQHEVVARWPLTESLI